MMINTLYSDAQLEIVHNKNNNIVYIKSVFSEHNSDEDYMQHITLITNILKDINYTRGILVDSSRNEFTVKVELQKWVAEQYIAALILKKTKRFAIILSQNLIKSLSVGQAVDEALDITKQIEIQLFTDFMLAEKWLLA